jgi:hypothetical protein
MLFINSFTLSVGHRKQNLTLMVEIPMMAKRRQWGHSSRWLWGTIILISLPLGVVRSLTYTQITVSIQIIGLSELHKLIDHRYSRH